MATRSTPQATARACAAWEDEIRALFEKPIKVYAERLSAPKGRATERSPEQDDVPEALAELVRKDAAPATALVTWGTLMTLFAAALYWGDEYDPDPPEPKFRYSARSFREGARGTFYLDGLQFGVMPEAERHIVLGTRRVVGQARRWSGIRFARAQGREGRGSELITEEFATNLGTAHRGDFAERLIADLRGYIAAGEAHSPRREKAGGLAETVSTPASRVVRDMINALDVSTPPYPAHMSPSTLARPLTVSAREDSAKPTVRALSQGNNEGLALRAMLEGARRVILVGSPGSGKSTALTGLVVDELREGRSAILVRLPDIARELNATAPPTDAATALQAVIDVAFRELALPVPAELPERDRCPATDSNLMVALDGFDEVKPSKRRRVLAFIRHLERIAGYVVVATRPLEVPNLPGDWVTAHMDSLPRNYSSGFLHEWFGRDSPDALERAMEAIRDRRAGDLTKNPATIGLIATVATQGGVPTTRAQLYDRYVSILLARKWRPADEQQPSAANIAARRRVAEDIAWMAVTAGNAVPRSGAWTDVVTLADIERYSSSTDLLVAEDLLRNDALLKSEGFDPSPRHQRYVWGHRTVHEHLVGSRLARLYREATVASQENLTRVAFGPILWREPLRHMIQLLDSTERRDYFDSLARLRLSGDPGDTIRFLEFDMARQVPEESTIWNEVAHRLAEEGSWHHVLELDRPLSEEAYSRALIDGRARDVHFLVSLPPDRRAELLPNLVARYRDRGAVAEQLYLNLLGELLSVNSDDAFRRYVDLLEGGSRARLSTPYHHDPAPPSDFVVRELTGRASRLPGPARMSLLRSLEVVGVRISEYSIPHGPVEPLDVHALDLIPRLSDAKFREPEEAETYRAMAYGEYGNDIAYTLGRVAVDAPDLGRDAPHAQLGLITTQLLRGDQIPGSDSMDYSEALSILENSAPTVFDDPRRAIELVRAAARLAANPAETTPGEAFNAYRSTLRLRNASALDFETRDGDFTCVVLNCVRDALFSHPRRSVVGALLASAPSDWPRVPGADPGTLDLLGILNMVPYDERVEDTSIEELVDVTVWAAKDALSALGCLEGDTSLDVDIERIANEVYKRAPLALALPGNAAWIAPALRELGLLYDWRDRLH